MPPITCIANDVMASVVTILRLQAGHACASVAEPRLFARGLVYRVAPEERNKLTTIRDVVGGGVFLALRVGVASKNQSVGRPYIEDDSVLPS